MLAPLLAGFAISSITVFALTSAGGTVARSTLPISTNLLIIFALLLCAVADLLFPRIRPTLFNRQTPASLSGRFSLPVTGLMWGLDTGTIVSTFRASAASWAALILTFAGWGPSWAGIAYAAGFCIPLGVLIATYPVAGGANGGQGWRHQSTESLVETLGGAAKRARYAAAVTAVAGVAVAVQGTF